MLANGTVYPHIAVEPKRYRIRFLNACNARFLNLQLYVAAGSPDGITLNAATGALTNSPGPTFRVLGTEAGFLQNPVDLPSNVPFNPVTLTGSLTTGPGERWDMLVDFTSFAGKSLILYNDAPAPFPVGDTRNDYFPLFNVKGNPVNATTTCARIRNSICANTQSPSPALRRSCRWADTRNSSRSMSTPTASRLTKSSLAV
jgi:spore coat protein A